jgi:hypothetical protein
MSGSLGKQIMAWLKGATIELHELSSFTVGPFFAITDINI